MFPGGGGGVNCVIFMDQGNKSDSVQPDFTNHAQPLKTTAVNPKYLTPTCRVTSYTRTFSLSPTQT